MLLCFVSFAAVRIWKPLSFIDKKVIAPERYFQPFVINQFAIEEPDNSKTTPTSAKDGQTKKTKMRLLVKPSTSTKATCPFCYGVQFCKTLESGDVKLEKPVRDSPVSFGVFKKQSVVAKALASDARLIAADEFFCTKKAKTKCHRAKVPLNPPEMATFILAGLKVVHRKTLLGNHVCMSPLVMVELRRLYGHETHEVFAFSFVVNPEPIYLKVYHAALLCIITVSIAVHSTQSPNVACAAFGGSLRAKNYSH